MQGNDFMADKIVPRGNISGDPDGCDASVHEIALHPFTAVGFLAYLVDLEPLGVSLVELAARNGTTRSHICQHGSNVVRPRATISRPPVKSDTIARICISNERRWAGIWTACKSRIVGALIGIL
jgi:hypothetical protein